MNDSRYSLHGWKDMIIKIPCRRGGQGRSVALMDELFEHGHGVSGFLFSVGLGSCNNTTHSKP